MGLLTTLKCKIIRKFWYSSGVKTQHHLDLFSLPQVIKQPATCAREGISSYGTSKIRQLLIAFPYKVSNKTIVNSNFTRL